MQNDTAIADVSSRRFPGLMVLACLAFCASLVFAVFTARSLYDDGSYYFMRVLEAGGFTEMIFSRGHAAFLFQLPVVIALKLGVTDLSKLQVAFGIGCFMSWPLAMVICFWLAPKHFWLVVLACGAGYLNAAFVAVGEHVVAHAFFWPACFVILFARPLAPMAAAVLLGSAAILLRSYESTLILGPVLAWLALRRAESGETKSWQRVVLLLAAFLFAASALFALDGTLHPATRSNVFSFRQGALRELAAPGWTVSWSCFWVLLMLATWSPKIRRLIASRGGIVLLAGMVLLWGAWPLLAPAGLDPYKQYDARFLDLLVPMVLLGVALELAHRPQRLEPQRQYLVNLSAALLLAQSLWHVAATEQWRGYLNVWKGMLATHTGLINLMDTPYGTNAAVGRQATRFVWEMDARNLEIEIGPRHVKSLILPDVKISGTIVDRELINDFQPKNLPHLERYGVDFSEYVKAVTQYQAPDAEPAKTK